MIQYLTHASIVQDGAFGVLLDERRIPICLTLERTFDDANTIILPGIHVCKKSRFMRGGYDTFEIHVEGHDRVLFHKANVESDLKGCIGLGFQFGRLHGTPGILQSGLAFDFWWSIVSPYDQFELHVI